MTRKIVQHILTICLLFSSVIFPLHAKAANANPAAASKAQIKATPEENFRHGASCLSQKNTACARLSLAAIPALSPYSKLLKGLIAVSENKNDEALLLLLPMQTEPQLSAPARIILHENLAEIFKQLADILQAAQHFMDAEAELLQTQRSDSLNRIEELHQKLWGLLETQNQDELIALRGNNTDPVFQGWIDLALGSRNPDFQTALSSWSSLYPDHPASPLSKKLSVQQKNSAATAKPEISDIRIALILPNTDDLGTEKLNAFQNGLESAIRLSKSTNPLKIFAPDELTLDIESRISAAKNEGFQHLIIPHLEQNYPAHFDISGNIRQLHISLNLDDEANTIAAFAISHAMQNVLVVTSLSAQSQTMLLSLKKAWEEQAGTQDSIRMIQLPQDISSNSVTMLELKSQLSAQPHDVVFLALTREEVAKIRPYLDISMPTITFSETHEQTPDNSSFGALNAIRFADIPWLLQINNSSEHSDIVATSMSNTLKRWFALGVDSLTLLTSAADSRNSAISGLSGTYSVSDHGDIKRSLILGRFTHQGITAD